MAATSSKYLESLFTPEEALAVLQREGKNPAATPNGCHISTRVVDVGGYPRRQLKKEELPAALAGDERADFERLKQKRKVSLHVLAAVAAGANVLEGDVSHRCPRGKRLLADQPNTDYGCFNPAHMVVESHAANMRRINCIIECPCCREYLCKHGTGVPAHAAGRPAEGKTTDHTGCIA